MIGYTLSWTNRQFDQLNNGKWFPYKYDRRHDVKIAVVHNINKRIQLSADWVYGTGVATTLPVSVYTNMQTATKSKYIKAAMIFAFLHTIGMDVGHQVYQAKETV